MRQLGFAAKNTENNTNILTYRYAGVACRSSIVGFDGAYGPYPCHGVDPAGTGWDHAGSAEIHADSASNTYDMASPYPDMSVSTERCPTLRRSIVCRVYTPAAWGRHGYVSRHECFFFPATAKRSIRVLWRSCYYSTVAFRLHPLLVTAVPPARWLCPATLR